MIELHPNPILQASYELNCPACRAPASYFKPDYGIREYAEAYECDCRWELPQLEYSDLLTQGQRVFRSRLDMWSKLRSDERQMALRQYETDNDNAQIIQTMLGFTGSRQVYLHGAGGVGKTHLTILAAVACFRRGLSVEYWPEIAFFENAQEYARSDSPVKTKPGQAGDVLILEDLGKTRATPYAAQMLYDVLTYRISSGRGLIITSNHPPEESAQRMVLDPRNADAVLSRLRAGMVIEMTSERDNREGSRA